jgi:quinone-modifying oxidoreductase subunit QmoC
MAKEYVADPDLQFAKDLIAAGGDDMKKCYQCATCSVACKVSPDNEPFPRKEMIWAQWGLKDKLLNDPDVWLCHQCNDCSTMCPRGANPGDTLKAIRKMTIEKHAWPSFMGPLAGNPSSGVLLLIVPVLVVLGLISLSGWRFPEGKLNYMTFVNIRYVQVVFSAALIFAVVSLVMSLRSYWTSLMQHSGAVGAKPFVPSLIEALKEILPHTTFKECDANNSRYSSHLLAFWGMIGLFVTTAIVAGIVDGPELFGGHQGVPPSQGGPGTLPIKILGNASAIAFILGLGLMCVRRLTEPEQAGNSSYFDWLFLALLFGTGFTGLGAELVRFSGSIPGAYLFYAVHLMFVLSLFLYLPFSKFAHLGYRTVAITWAKAVGRNRSFPIEANAAASVEEMQKAS